MHPPEIEAAPRRSVIRRFTRPERFVHHATAILMLICIVTASILYFPPISAAVGRRAVVTNIHILAGFGLPVPAILGWLSDTFRDDLRRLNRFSPTDWAWLRNRDRRMTVHGRGTYDVGKFNAGQKLNAAFIGGAILVMLGTGYILVFPRPFSDSWRTGATFVHDWLFLAIFAVVIGHLWYALRDGGALSGMFLGRVPRDWAARNHAGWLDEQESAKHSSADS